MTVRRLLLALSVVACASPPPSAPPAVTGASPSASITVSLASVSVEAALRDVSQRTRRTLAIDPSAASYAGCARISLVTPGPVAPESVFALLTTALEPSGFALTVAPDGLVLRHRGAPVPVGCAAAGDVDPVAAPTAPTVDVPDLHASTRSTSDTDFEITRAWRDAIAADPTGLVADARVVPHEEGGRAVGLRLYGIRPGSRLAALGFENGDTVRTVNGYEIASPDQALETYARVRDADVYTVALQRRGLARTHTIRVVDELAAPSE